MSTTDTHTSPCKIRHTRHRAPYDTPSTDIYTYVYTLCRNIPYLADVHGPRPARAGKGRVLCETVRPLPVRYAAYIECVSILQGGVPIYAHTPLPVRHAIYTQRVSHREGCAYTDLWASQPQLGLLQD